MSCDILEYHPGLNATDAVEAKYQEMLPLKKFFYSIRRKDIYLWILGTKINNKCMYVTAGLSITSQTVTAV